MNDLRRDYLTGDWVAISTARAARPTDFGSTVQCPFCPQNEHMTPRVVYRHGQARVFANKYPALTTENPDAYGIHEVLVDTDAHDEQLHEFPLARVTDALTALQARQIALSADKRIRYVQLFKNQGRSGGASLTHSHWQILAASVLLPKQERIRDSFDDYFHKNGACYLCGLFKQPQAGRIVLENEHVIAYVPYAALFSDGAELMPRRHVTDFSQLTPDELTCLAAALKQLLAALCVLHPGCGYNICIQNGVSEASHLYVQIIPRLGSLAGFELATGCYINSSDPDESARRYKAALKFIQ